MLVPRNRIEHFLPFLGKQMIFIHTPKCGGSFVNYAFGKRFKRCPTLRWKEAKGHKTYLEYKEIFEKRNQNIHDYTMFSVIRNPWSWHVSYFHYIKSGRSGHHLEHQLFQKMAFSDYLKWLSNPDAKRGPQGYLTKQVSDWIIDEDGKVAVEYILRQENLEKDFLSMIKKEDIFIMPATTKVNTSKHADYRTYYSDRDAEIIAIRHTRDIFLFNYTFDNG